MKVARRLWEALRRGLRDEGAPPPAFGGVPYTTVDIDRERRAADDESAHDHEVHTPAAGRVTHAGWISGNGQLLCVTHTRALAELVPQNTSLRARAGDSVRRGKVIALSGCTGDVSATTFTSQCTGPLAGR